MNGDRVGNFKISWYVNLRDIKRTLKVNIYLVLI